MRRIVKKYFVPHHGNDHRPYLLRGVGILVLFVVMAGAFFASDAYRLALKTSTYLASVLPAVLADMANNDRASSALSSLTVSDTLVRAAQLKANDMAANSYFAHISPAGKTPWYWFGLAGYNFIYAGENLAVNFDDSAAVNSAWMNSPGHRANILNSHFTEIGIATARGTYEGHDTLFVVELFGYPAPKPGRTAAVAPVTEPRAAKPEPALVPIASSTVLGASEQQTFVAVKNADALAASAPAVPVAAAPHYASLFERLVTSPTKLLGLAYTLFGAVLFALLMVVLLVRHDRRFRHTLTVLMAFVLLTSCYFAYKAFVPSPVVIAVSPSQGL